MLKNEPHMSNRERQIFLLLADTPPVQIARDLKLSKKTIYTYLERLRHKFKCSTFELRTVSIAMKAQQQTQDAA